MSGVNKAIAEHADPPHVEYQRHWLRILAVFVQSETWGQTRGSDPIYLTRGSDPIYFWRSRIEPVTPAFGVRYFVCK